MSECASKGSCGKESCEGCPSNSAAKKTDFLVSINGHSSVKQVIGVVSGKGGVGKSSVTSLLASAIAKTGRTVGIMDADITGPSIPKMFGVKGPVVGNGQEMAPIEAENGVRIMSMNLLLDDEDAPVIWRGPVIAGVVKQFWTDTVWGDLDVMLVDMPPGTGDVPLTVFQSLPLAGVVMVTSPQDLVSMVVKKAMTMADKMDVPVLGVVENYSYFKCHDCGKEHKIFGESNIAEIADDLGTQLIGRLPINPEIAKLADEGRIFDAEIPEMDEIVKAVLS